MKRNANWTISKSDILCAILAYLICIPGPSASAQKPAVPPVTSPAMSNLTIRVTGERNTKGKIVVWLFNAAKGFPTDATKIMRQLSVTIDPNTKSAEVTFKDVPQDTYAVSVLHDENNNGVLDKNFMGIPKEGYGASNNPPKKMSAPNFEESKFALTTAEQTIEIKLIYW